MAACARPSSYAPRTTQARGAVPILREHLGGFLERLDERAGSLPAFVKDELEAFVGCGDFERGFMLAACRRCGEQVRVPFSCKGRGFCPSCLGRRMAEGAALLVDEVLPPVGYRQWVLTFEGSMAVRLGYDSELLCRVSRCFAHRVSQHVRRAVKRHHGLPSMANLHAGVLSVVQRFRADLGLFVHLHDLVTDGAFAELEDGSVKWYAAPPPTDDDLRRILTALARDLDGLTDDDLDVDEGLSACAQLSLSGPSFAKPSIAPSPPAEPLVASGFGMRVHAATVVDGRDRRRLERVCRYLLRPPFAQDAIEALPDGRVRVHFKKPTRWGTSFVDLDIDTFLARLVALVPPPRVHLVRHYGVFANRHRLRPHIIPRRESCPPKPRQLPLFADTAGLVPLRSAFQLPPVREPRRLSWARLLARVFSIDVTICQRCQGPMRSLQAVTHPDEIARLLHRARAPPRPSPPGQQPLFAA